MRTHPHNGYNYISLGLSLVNEVIGTASNEETYSTHFGSYCVNPWQFAEKSGPPWPFFRAALLGHFYHINRDMNFGHFSIRIVLRSSYYVTNVSLDFYAYHSINVILNYNIVAWNFPLECNDKVGVSKRLKSIQINEVCLMYICWHMNRSVQSRGLCEKNLLEFFPTSSFYI